MISGKVKKWLADKKKQGKKGLAVLIDPDEYTDNSLDKLLHIARKHPPDLFLVGGSLLVSARFEELILRLKSANLCPVLIFPGSNMHLSPHADGLLLLSLLSGRNPEFLIGQQVVAAPIIRNMQLEPIPTAYLLIDSGKQTTVSYMSNTTPIPADKPAVAVATALAGEMLGFKMLYLDGGSGAQKHVPLEMVRQVNKNTNLLLCVGGGIRTAQLAEKLYRAGADWLVVGNHLEEKPDFLSALEAVKNSCAS